MTEKEIRLPDGLDVETATDVLREFSRIDGDAQIVNSDTLSGLKDEINAAKEAFAAVLAEESPQSADTLARQDMDALTEPFRDEEGEIDVDTLRQNPETGSGNGAGEGGEPGDEFNPEQITRSDMDNLDTLRKKHTAFTNRGMEKRASEIEAEMVDTVNAPDFDTLQEEVF